MGARLDYSAYRGLEPRAQGAYPPSGYGRVDGVPCVCIDSGVTATLASGISATDVEATVTDASRLPDAPFTLQCGYERIRVTQRDGVTLSITRGWDSTVAAPHAAGARAYEVLDAYVYLLADHPVKQVDAVYIDGQYQSAGYTAYTGQSGDEHPSHPGVAVIELSAAPYLGRQRNLAPADIEARERGVEAGGIVASASSPLLHDGLGVTHVELGAKASQCAWVAFAPSSGTVLRQTYRASVENSSSEAPCRVRLSASREGAAVAVVDYDLVARESATIEMPALGGAHDDRLTLTLLSGGAMVSSLGKTTVIEALEEDAVSSVAQPRMAGFAGRGSVSARGRQRLWVRYSQEESGQMLSERHEAVVAESTGMSDALVRLCSRHSGHFREFVVPAGKEAAIALEHPASGQWDNPTEVIALRGEALVQQIGRTVFYRPADADYAGSEGAECSAHVVIGEAVTADASMAVDQSGDYGGAGTLIERPDHVIRHCLASRMGVAASAVDTESFDEAGALYAGAIDGGYAFAFLYDSETPLTALVRSLAFQCRSVLRFERGLWRLGFLPDEAPQPVRSISRDELAGEGAMFVFTKTPLVDVANSVTAWYKKDYSTGGFGLSAYASDAASIAACGAREAEFELDAVRTSSMAAHVLQHILLQRRAPLLRVEFPVFHDHTDLMTGQSIEVDNPLFGGVYCIEGVKRPDSFHAVISAIGWW